MLYRLIAVSSIAALSIYGQGRGGSTGSSTGSSTGGGASAGTVTTPGRGTTSNLPTNPSTFPTDAPRPILITGKVVLDDGTPPPTGILIERICAAQRPHPEGYTDSKGHFTITLGQEMGVMPDASETASRSSFPGSNPLNGGVTESSLNSCELRAMLPGYRSETISLAGKRYMGESEVGTMILHRMANVEGLTISATSVGAPKDAKKAYEHGMDAIKKNKVDDAQKDFEKAVDVYPKYAAAWFELGRLYQRRDHYDQAKEAYNKSIAADSKYVNPYEGMYILAFREQKWQDVADLTEKVIRMNPYDFPSAFYYNGLANLQLQKWDAAEKSAREAVKLDTHHENPRTNYILGIALANKHDFEAAAECLRTYLKDAPDAKDANNVRQQLASLEKELQARVKQN
jgi:tetratricopeptide (TPR) repeat protein